MPEDQSPAATLRLQLVARRKRGGASAVARLDAELAAAFEATGLAWLRGQIRGLGDSQLHNLLALKGDPRRLDDARCMAKLAGSKMYTNHFGFVSDYLAEVFHNVRKSTYMDVPERFREFGPHVGGRTAVRSFIGGRDAPDPITDDRTFDSFFHQWKNDPPHERGGRWTSRTSRARSTRR